MSKLAKNIFYGLAFGLSALMIIWIFISKKSTVGKPVNFGLVMLYVLLVLAVIAALMLSIKGLIINVKSAIMFGVGLGVMLLLVIIGYALDNHEVMKNYPNYGVSTETYSGIIGGSLIASWIILGGAVVLTLYAAISDFIKRL
jgi:hypothetical protein